ncbi:MAG: hypothetical protein AAFQ44_02200 [Pseudomonadota bacterium]
MATAIIIDDAGDERFSLAGWLAQALGVVAVWLAFAWPWLIGRVTIPWDGKAQFAPQVQFLAASFARGEWPWWAPNVFAGHPQIADPQSMIFSPPMVILALIDATPDIAAIDTAVLLTVLFGGLGVMTFARMAGWHWAAGLVAAAIFMFGGSMAWRLQHFGQVMSLAYVPFTLVCLHFAIHRGSFAAAVGAGILGAAVLLGRDQVGLLAIYCLIGFVIYEFIAWPNRWPRIKRAIAPLAVGLLVGLALIALPLLMTLSLAEMSNRPSIDLTGAQAGSLHPALLATAAVANLFGSAGDMADFWGPPSFHWENTGLFTAQNMGVVYISAFGLMAFVYSLVRDRAADKPVAFFLIAANFALVYALGWFTPVFALIYEWLPGIDKFRRPADATFLACAFLSLPVGYALHLMLAEIREERDRWQLPVMIAVAFLAIGAAMAIALWRGKFGQALPQLLAGAGLFSGTIGVWLFARWLMPIRPVFAGTLIVAAVTADLVISNGPNGATALPRATIDMLDAETPHPTIKRLQELVEAGRKNGRRDRVELTGLGYHWPNASLTHGLENTLGMNPVRLDWYVKTAGACDTVGRIEQRRFTSRMPDYGSNFADQLGLRYVVTDGVAPNAMTSAGALKLIDVVGTHHIYENEGTLPRAIFQASGGTTPNAAVRITRYENTRVEIEVTTDVAGLLVLHDTYHPWWQATVNGGARPMAPQALPFRGVALQAGQHTVRFDFDPLSGVFERVSEAIFGIEGQALNKTTAMAMAAIRSERDPCR